MGKRLTVPELERLAMAGEAVAQNELGLRYETGDGVAKSDRKAAGWYKKAAKEKRLNPQKGTAVFGQYARCQSKARPR